MVVTVTDPAKEELQRILSVSSLDSGKYLRLATPPLWEGGGDFGIVIDSKRQGDHVVDHEGGTLLLIDQGLADHLSESVLDFKDSPDGPRFALDVY